MSNKGQTSSNNKSKLKTENVKLEKSNNSNLKQFLQSKKGQYSLMSVLVLGVLLISGLFTYNLLKQDDTAKAASTTFATGNVTLDKKYVVNGTESDVVNTTPGGTITVRLRYSNTGTSAATDASIKDTLPAGFSYVAGSFKNCLNPSSTELVCDALNATNKNTAFTTLTSTNGISPSAGLYDAASNSAGGGTAVTANSGVLSMGKKRFVIQRSCWNDTRQLRQNYLLGVTNTPSPYPGSVTSDQLCKNTFNGNDTFGNGSFSSDYTIDTMGQRFISNRSCWSDTRQFRLNYILATGNIGNPFPGSVASDQLCKNTFSSLESYGVGSTSVDYTIDTLSLRYAGQRSCWDDTNQVRHNSIISYTNTVNPYPGTTISDAVCKNTFSGNYSYGTGSLSSDFTVDTSDTARSSGYIEYQALVASNTALGSYGTNATLSSTSSAFTPIASGANVIISGNTTVGIVVGATPTANVTSTKLYSTDGINWGSTITAYPGQNVYVRLLRDNSGTGSANAVNQKDTIPSPFTYVAGSFKNCLAPTIVDITDTLPDISGIACDTLTATNKDTAFTKLISNTGISAAAGLYDGVDTGANGTAISANTGLMEFGKVRFIRLQSIGYTNGSAPDGCGVYIVSPSNTAFSATGTPNCGYIISVGITNAKFLQHESIGFTNFQPPNECVSYGAAWTGTNINTSAGSGCASRIATTILNLKYLIFETIAYTNGTTSIPCSLYDAAITAGNSPVSAVSGNSCGSRSSINLQDTTNGQAYIQYQITTLTTAALGNYGTTGTLSSTDPANTFSQTSGSTGTGITLVNPPLTTADIPGLTLVCGGGNTVPVNSTTTCTFTLPTGKALPTSPNDFKLGIGTATPAGTCTVTNVTTGAVTCTGVPTGTQTGNQPINGQIGTGTVTPTGETVNVGTAVDPDLASGPGSLSNSTDCTSTTSVVIGATYTCTFPINGTGPFALPSGGIQAKTNQGTNNSTPVSTCTISGSILTCSGITTVGTPNALTAGSGNVQLGKGTTPATWNNKGSVLLTVSNSLNCSTTDPCALFDTALTYSPTQANAKRYGGSGSTTADNLILTLKDTRLETSGYTTTCSFRYKFKSDTTWRNLSSTVAYNNTTGCTSTLLKADQLFWNVDFEITSQTTNGTTTKNYLLYSNYDFKAGSIGVTSIGGSGL